MENLTYSKLLANEAPLLVDTQAQLLLAAKLFHHVSESTLITDTRGIIVDASGPFCELSGWRKGQLVGTNVNELLKADSSSSLFVPQNLPMLAKIQAQHAHLLCNFSTRTTKPVVVRVSAVCNENGSAISYVLTSSGIPPAATSPTEHECD